MSQSSVFIVSDSTGETASTMTRAALVQYKDQDVHIVRYKNVRSEEQLRAIVDEAKNLHALIIYTFASSSMRIRLAKIAEENGVPQVDLLGPLMNALGTYFGKENTSPEIGLLRAVDDRYFKRIEAIEYTVKHDDGKNLTELDKADVILVGISRTSKTPLSIFLSHKGWKVANIPFVLTTPLPEELFKVDQRRIVGLLIDETTLLRIRRKRLEKFGQDPNNEYATLEYIHKEIEQAKMVFKKNRKWPVFDVTDRALEETAGEIIRVVATRLNLPYEVLL